MRPILHIHPPHFWQAVLLALAALAFALTALVPMDAGGAESIGSVAKKRLDVYGTSPDGGRERKYPRYDVVFGELIETSGGGAVLIRLDDETELYLGERASLVIDDFVYDPVSKTGRAVYEFTVGTLRYVSGEMQETHISILTPNANIGIRGSEAIIFVTPDGDTFVNVTAGRFSVRSRDRPETPAVTVSKGQNVSLSGADGFSPVGQGIKMPEYTHGPEVKVPDFSDDFDDVKSGGGMEQIPEGTDAGSRTDDSGGHGSHSHDGHDGGGH